MCFLTRYCRFGEAKTCENHLAMQDGGGKHRKDKDLQTDGGAVGRMSGKWRWHWLRRCARQVCCSNALTFTVSFTQQSERYLWKTTPAQHCNMAWVCQPLSASKPVSR